VQHHLFFNVEQQISTSSFSMGILSQNFPDQAKMHLQSPQHSALEQASRQALWLWSELGKIFPFHCYQLELIQAWHLGSKAHSLWLFMYLQRL